MQAIIVRTLLARRPQIRARWEALLRIERVTSPLAHPEMLVHLIDWSIDEVFAALRPKATRKNSPAPCPLAALRDECACGLNPFLAFFLAGEQAVLEALVLAQAAEPALAPGASDTAVSELYFALRQLRRREVESFCSLCQHRADHRPAVRAATQARAPCSRSR